MTGDEGGAFDVSQQQARIAFDAVDPRKRESRWSSKPDPSPTRARPFQFPPGGLRTPARTFRTPPPAPSQAGRRLRLDLPEPDTQFAFVLDENEHLLDRRLIAVRNQEDLPPEIAMLRVERSERRYLVRMHHDVCLSQFPQVVEQRNRVRAGIEYLAVRLEDDFKCRTNVGYRL
jgi:hypothetical protein